jgi:hypothetical protein
MGRSWQLRFPDRPCYVPEFGGTAFHEFFGLAPTKAEAASDSEVETIGVVGVLERENDQQISRMKARAEETFKQATTPDAQERVEKLWLAQQRLSAVTVMDTQTYVPCLLLVHVALGQSQTLQAFNHLADAVARRPSFFGARPNIASYYGDYDAQSEKSLILETQMRGNLQIGDQRPTWPGGYAVQAYCAWVLNDRVRVEYALGRVEELERQGIVDPKMLQKILAVHHAILAAIK